MSSKSCKANSKRLVFFLQLHRRGRNPSSYFGTIFFCSAFSRPSFCLHSLRLLAGNSPSSRNCGQKERFQSFLELVSEHLSPEGTYICREGNALEPGNVWLFEGIACPSRSEVHLRQAIWSGTPWSFSLQNSSLFWIGVWSELEFSLQFGVKTPKLRAILDWSADWHSKTFGVPNTLICGIDDEFVRPQLSHKVRAFRLSATLPPHS